MARKRILWVVPVFQSVYPRPFASFMVQAINTHLVSDRYEFAVWVPERQILHSAMNQAVEIVLKHQFDAMIVSDDDCFPPADVVPKLLKHYEDGLDFVAAVGYMRGFPHTTTVGRYFPEGVTLTIDADTKESKLAGFEWIEKLDDEKDDLVPADFCGFPIAMIRREALQRIEAPWFGTEIDGGSCTHDVYFGRKAAKAGVKILVDRRLTCGHLTEAPIITAENREIKRAVADRWIEAHKQAAENQP